MTLHELVAYLNTNHNTELEVIPFTIHASVTYNVVFLRSKKEPHIARFTVEKLHVCYDKDVIRFSANSSYCFEEIAVIDLLTAAVQANAVAEKHGITQIISPNCRMDRVTKMAEQIPFGWHSAYDDRMATIRFAKKFRSDSSEQHEVNKTTIKLTEVPR